MTVRPAPVSPDAAPPDPARVARVLVDLGVAVERRRRRARWARAAGDGAAIALTGVVALALADRAWDLPASARAAGLAATLAGAAVRLARVRTTSREKPDVRAARELERLVGLAGGRMDEALVTLAWDRRDPAPGVSRAMLAEIARRAGADLAARGLPATGERRGAAIAWARAGAAVVGVVLLSGVPTVMLGDAVLRVVGFWQGRVAVTGLRLIVEPGDTRIDQGTDLTIAARLEGESKPAPQSPAPALGPPVYLETTYGDPDEARDDPSAWSRAEMSPRGVGGYLIVVPAVRRPFAYRTATGRTLSRIYTVAVRTTPAARDVVLELTDRTAGPDPARSTLTADRMPDRATSRPTTDRPDDTADVRTATVRAGVEVALRVSATEPLASADLAWGQAAGESDAAGRLAMSLDPADPTTARVAVPASALAGETNMLTLLLRGRRTRGDDTEGPRESTVALLIHAVPDRPPSVTIQRPTDGTPAGPRDDLEVAVSAEDDTALTALRLELTREGGLDPAEATTLPATTQSPLALPAPGRRATVAVRVPLAGTGVRPGERLRLVAIARDSGRQETRSDPVHVLVSGAAADPLAPVRARALEAAAARVGAARDRLRAAAERVAAATGFPDDGARDAALESARTALAAAAEAIAAAQRALGRCVRLSPSAAFSDAMEAYSDRTVGPGARAESVFTFDLAIPDTATLRRLADAIAADADRLAAILPGLDALRLADEARVSLARLSLARLSLARNADGDDATNALNPAEPGDATARAALDAAKAATAKATSPDFSAPPGDDAGPLPLRLDAAWRIESLRPDALPRRSADLALSARAADVLLRAGGLPGAFAAALRDLAVEHAWLRAAANPVSGPVLIPADVTDAADAARRAMDAWAGPSGGTVATLQAIADAADQSRPPGVSAEAEEARRTAGLVALEQSQRQLETAVAALSRPVDRATADMLAGRLDDLLKKLAPDAPPAKPDAPPVKRNPRDDRLEAFRAAASAEQHLADLEPALAAWADAARAALPTPGGEPVSPESVARLRAAADAVAVAHAETIRDELKRFVPELAPAAQRADRTLKPALARIRTRTQEIVAAVDSGSVPAPAAGAAAIDDALQAAGGAVTTVRRELADARRAMTARDPVVAARAAVAAAGTTLRKPDPDPAAAARLMRSASDALETAVTQSLRGPMDRVLATLPELSAYFDADPAADASAGFATDPATLFPSTRRTDTPPAQAYDESAVPPEFRPAVRAYFDRLARQKGGAK